jgi:hypothetical protein
MDWNPERARIEAEARRTEHWSHWGPYLSDRQWGTVREDYSATGEAWTSFPFEHARSRAYRWGEDGIFGISDDHQRLCFAPAFWNGNDPILKERLFGLSGPQGNHGEDVKELYYHLDNVPSHAYMRALYKYPQRAFPYADLVETSARRTRQDPEYELIDTGIFSAMVPQYVVVVERPAAPDDRAGAQRTVDLHRHESGRRRVRILCRRFPPGIFRRERNQLRGTLRGRESAAVRKGRHRSRDRAR